MTISSSKSTGYHHHSGYINQSSLRNDPFAPASTVITSGGRRRPSVSRSESSDIPLEPGIHTKTAFVVQEEYPKDGRARG